MKLCANHIQRRHRSVNVEEKPPIINLPSTREAILGAVIRRTAFANRTTACTWAVRVEAKLKVRWVSTGLPEQRT
ncbi:hypothetical protein Poly21_56410 [Allorhodopirellula heiligendammensis]|uniref:Uncharacterized protein n=1 Tax=Allorhodopirellula heiligendammensis TaxID=2714739 RepID=A0A5C6B4M2_9BACT|nr:hypothetical protein Poly21_56410 [Allorhodopirellula heiligendammensis]